MVWKQRFDNGARSISSEKFKINLKLKCKIAYYFYSCNSLFHKANYISTWCKDFSIISFKQPSAFFNRYILYCPMDIRSYMNLNSRANDNFRNTDCVYVSYFLFYWVHHDIIYIWWIFLWRIFRKLVCCYIDFDSFISICFACWYQALKFCKVKCK